MKVADVNIDLSSAVVMTILNVTPDSFFAESRNESREQIERSVSLVVEQGASIIDIGGYSSRPGAVDVSVCEEIRRVAMGVELVRKIAPQMAVSVDTFRSEVVSAIVSEFGACIVNDISAGELDSQMLNTVAKLGVPYIAMHMRSTPQTMQQNTEYDNIVCDVKDYFEHKIEQLRGLGIDDIVIDPGFGFAKQTKQNFELLGGLHELAELGVPMLVGVSRKSMIYRTLDCTPEESLVGTSALHWEALLQGAKILRVHDTLAAAQVIKLFNEYKKSI